MIRWRIGYVTFFAKEEMNGVTTSVQGESIVADVDYVVIVKALNVLFGANFGKHFSNDSIFSREALLNKLGRGCASVRVRFRREIRVGIFKCRPILDHVRGVVREFAISMAWIEVILGG